MTISVISSLLIYLQEDRDNRRSIEAHMMREIGLQMGQLQNILYNRLTEGDEAEALLSISLVAMRPGINTLVLADDQHRVMLANSFRWKGEPAALHTLYSETNAKLVSQGDKSRLSFNARQPSLLQGYYPLVVAYRHGGLDKQMGILYVEADISEQLQAARHSALEQSLVFGLITFLAAIFIAYILHRLVSRRVGVLSATASRFAAGDFAARTGLKGRDELSELGKSFDNMAQRVGETIALRDRAMQEQKRILETTADGYWQTDLRGCLLDVNGAYCQMSGYSREDLLDMCIPQLEVNEATPDAVRMHIADIIAKGADRFESVHRRKDGTLFDVEVSTTYWPDAGRFIVFIREISDRVRARKELQSRKEEYDRLTTNIPIGVYLLHTSPDGVFDFKYVSQRFCRMLGQSAEEIYADSSAAFKSIHPDDLDRFVKENQAAVKSLKPFNSEVRVQLDGEERWLRSESRPEAGENGECTWDGVMIDITERVTSQSELQREQERLDEAQKVGHFGSWELDLISGRLTWSDQIFTLFEIDQSRFGASYEAFLDGIHPDDREKVNNAYSASLIDKKPYQITHRLLMADGRIKWVEERCSSTFDDAGKPTRSIGTVQDVTEREILAEEGRIASVAFETQEALIVTDRHANIIKVNRAFEETTGYSQEEALGKNPRILASGRHDKAFYQEMWASVLNDGRWSGEVWDRRKGGEIYPKWLTITAVKHLDEITHFVAVFVDITERKKAEEEIRNLAFYDPLTSLPNRRLLQDHLHRALSQSARNDQYGALMFLDLDHFKILNDTKGHEYGDKLLVEVARRLSGCVRDTDTLSRFGGDEFVVLLEGMNVFKEEAVAQAGRIAEKIREALSQPYQLEGVLHRSTPSIGVVLFRGGEVNSEELLKRADLAMYQSKEAGRNKVTFFEASMQAVLESRTLLEGALRQALPKGELEMYYQLQTDESKALLGAEVLLRWRSAELGMVSPAQFIPMAEQTKLILPIGHWVLENACRQLKLWESHPVLGHMHLAVNISPVQFHQPDFVRQVKEILQESGADPRRLELELTENLVLEDIDEATRKMAALKEIGVRFSMDDFGTGYSSLQYIKRLPIDLLKIDQSFVRDILTDPGDAMMVQTISGMAQNFGFGVIAEGVEEHAQIAPLVARGCGKFQGYLFSRPVPLQDFEKLVEQWKTD
ncbi:MAG: EAL domain-containing protein [Gammaproteobacteria bacterium]|nr:EAL domain-containing protein [Gammaproteobacteria bacterium]MBU1625696.1 EAL domain-containing protein [Gammaproteobacteria bacterium]